MSDAPKKSMGRLLLWVVLGSCIAISALAAIGRANRPATTAQATPASAAAAAPTEPPVPTDLPRPSPVPASTRGPTETTGPTLTPSPEPSPTEPPTPTPLPEPIVIEGSGQSVTDPFTPPSTLNRVIFEHHGKRNFIVQSYDSTGATDHMVNAIGNYQGSRPLLGSKGPYYLEINADGAWKVTIESLTMNEANAQGIEGQGEYVSDFFTPVKQGPVPHLFTHTGKRNFIVQLYCAGGSDVVQNQIGAVDGAAVVRFSEGPCMWDVKADGAWSIRPK